MKFCVQEMNTYLVCCLLNEKKKRTYPQMKQNILQKTLKMNCDVYALRLIQFPQISLLFLKFPVNSQALATRQANERKVKKCVY